MGKVVKLRIIVYSSFRWKFTFEFAKLTQRDKAALTEAIGLLRWKNLPLPLDRDASFFPPLFIPGTYSHYVAGTCLRVVYRFTEKDGEPFLLLISIHRIVG